MAGKDATFCGRKFSRKGWIPYAVKMRIRKAAKRDGSGVSPFSTMFQSIAHRLLRPCAENPRLASRPALTGRPQRHSPGRGSTPFDRSPISLLRPGTKNWTSSFARIMTRVRLDQHPARGMRDAGNLDESLKDDHFRISAPRDSDAEFGSTHRNRSGRTIHAIGLGRREVVDPNTHSPTVILSNSRSEPALR